MFYLDLPNSIAIVYSPLWFLILVDVKLIMGSPHKGSVFAIAWKGIDSTGIWAPWIMKLYFHWKTNLKVTTELNLKQHFVNFCYGHVLLSTGIWISIPTKWLWRWYLWFKGNLTFREDNKFPATFLFFSFHKYLRKKSKHLCKFTHQLH